MNVVVEKRLAELQEEYEKMRTTWVDPDQHHKIKKELESISQANQTIEVRPKKSFVSGYPSVPFLLSLTLKFECISRDFPVRPYHLHAKTEQNILRPTIPILKFYLEHNFCTFCLKYE